MRDHSLDGVGVVHVRGGRAVHSVSVDLGLRLGRRQRVGDRVHLEDVEGQQEALGPQLVDQHRHPHHQPRCQRHLTSRHRSAAEDSRHLAYWQLLRM